MCLSLKDGDAISLQVFPTRARIKMGKQVCTLTTETEKRQGARQGWVLSQWTGVKRLERARSEGGNKVNVCLTSVETGQTRIGWEVFGTSFRQHQLPPAPGHTRLGILPHHPLIFQTTAPSSPSPPPHHSHYTLQGPRTYPSHISSARVTTGPLFFIDDVMNV